MPKHKIQTNLKELILGQLRRPGSMSGPIVVSGSVFVSVLPLFLYGFYILRLLQNEALRNTLKILL